MTSRSSRCSALIRGNAMRWRLGIATGLGMLSCIFALTAQGAAPPRGTGGTVDVDRVFARSRLAEELRTQLAAAVRPLEEQFRRVQVVAELTPPERQEI